MPTSGLSSREFARALKAVGRPKGRQLDFLRAHYRATGRVMTMSRLADAAGYGNYGGVNLQYGGLASRIAKVLKRPTPTTKVALLVDFIDRRSISNKDWVLLMKPSFARALRMPGWV